MSYYTTTSIYRLHDTQRFLMHDISSIAIDSSLLMVRPYNVECEHIYMLLAYILVHDCTETAALLQRDIGLYIRK